MLSLLTLEVIWKNKSIEELVMNNANNWIKNHIIVLLGVIFALLFIFAILFNISQANKHNSPNQHKNTSVVAKNNSTSINIPNVSQYEIDRLSDLILHTAKLNGVKSKTKIILRENSVNQTYDDKEFTYTTDFIVDLPDVKQSYRVHNEYHMIPHKYGDDYALLVTCPHPEDLIYPTFKCTDRIKQEGGTE